MRGSAICQAIWLLAFGPVASAAEMARNCEIVINTAPSVDVRFTVELARNDEQRATGLMGRNLLAQRHGMLFDFGHERRVSMWMKDTLITLDMVFFAQDGRLLFVERTTEPTSLRKITPPMPIRYVLEVNAGESAGFDPELSSRLDLARLAQCP